MLGLLSKLFRQSGRLRGNDPQRALCHPTFAHPGHAGQGLHARQRRRTRLRKLKGTEHLAKVMADVQFYNGERGESLPETMMSNTTNEDDFVLSPKC
jgi:hypothetical protein